MNKSIYVVLSEEIFQGNLLDIGMENYGIMYDAYKQFNDEISIDYINSKEESSIREDYYDKCILLFSFSKIKLRKNKFKLIREIHRYLKVGGSLYIWDIDKGYNEIYNFSVKIETPNKKLKEINIRDFNILKDSSIINTMKLLDCNFEVIDFNTKDRLYYIKANKIEREKDRDESCAGSC